MRTFIITLFLLLPLLSSLQAEAQKKADSSSQKKPTTAAKKTTPDVPPLSEEELAAIALKERREKLIEEMLPNTRALTFIDSLVVDKDAFLPHLRMTRDIGLFVPPETMLPSHLVSGDTGSAAYVNSLGSAAYFAMTDSLGNMRLHASYRNNGEWIAPQPLDEFAHFDYQDYPFLLTDGSTLYFAASGDESIGGLDLFATRFNEETRQFVRPQNLGFPYNSTANDYLLAIDEELQIGVLVTDRDQPDDKVCIYWFIDDRHRNSYNFDADEEDEDEDAIDDDEEDDNEDHAPAISQEERMRRFAAIASIADTQRGHEDDIARISARWHQALAAQAEGVHRHVRFVISDAVVYTHLDHFVDSTARALAAQWLAATDELASLESRQEALRYAYAQQKTTSLATTLRGLEQQVVAQRTLVAKLAKDYRAAEQAAMKESAPESKAGGR